MAAHCNTHLAKHSSASWSACTLHDTATTYTTLQHTATTPFNTLQHTINLPYRACDFAQTADSSRQQQTAADSSAS